MFLLILAFFFLQTLKQAELFIRKNRDRTRCPKEERYFFPMFQVDPEPNSKLFFNIGANKGFTFIDLLGLWGRGFLRSKGISKSSWQKLIGAPCGACRQCKGIEYSEWSLMELASQEAPLIYAFEPMAANFDPVEEGISKAGIESRVKLYPFAFGAAPGQVQFELCGQRFSEHCGIKGPGIVSKGKKFVQVELESVDNVLKRFDLHERTIDLLLIDTEGNDAAVLQGARHTLERGAVRFISFEYHKVGLWSETTLKSQIDYLDEFGFDCFWAGQAGVWRITGCWDQAYEYKHWSNVVCAHRNDIWWTVLEAIDVKKGIM